MNKNQHNTSEKMIDAAEGHTFYVQSWKPGRMYPDFITAAKVDDETAYGKLYTLKAKLTHC